MIQVSIQSRLLPHPWMITTGNMLMTIRNMILVDRHKPKVKFQGGLRVCIRIFPIDPAEVADNSSHHSHHSHLDMVTLGTDLALDMDPDPDVKGNKECMKSLERRSQAMWSRMEGCPGES